MKMGEIDKAIELTKEIFKTVKTSEDLEIVRNYCKDLLFIVYSNNDVDKLIDCISLLDDKYATMLNTEKRDYDIH